MNTFEQSWIHFAFARRLLKICSRVVFSLLFYGNQRVKSTRKKYSLNFVRDVSSAISSHSPYQSSYHIILIISVDPTSLRNLKSSFLFYFWTFQAVEHFRYQPWKWVTIYETLSRHYQRQSIFEDLHLLEAIDNFRHLIKRN